MIVTPKIPGIYKVDVNLKDPFGGEFNRSFNILVVNDDILLKDTLTL